MDDPTQNTVKPIPVSREEQERKEILRQYRKLIETWHTQKTVQDRWEVRKAFKMAAEAHKDMRRKSGEPFIFHPLAVATIVAGEMGLGKTSIISALLHDTVEDTDITLEVIENIFGKKVARIIDGLTKIEGISETASTSAQAATIKKVLFSLSDDVRVILIKLADRLHNMRTLDSMPRLKQLKIASETLYIYAPLAHRLGLYEIKTELEELSFKYQNPEAYKKIRAGINQLRPELLRRFETFKKPLEEEIKKSGKKIKLNLREKSGYSIWVNMKKKEINFEDVYLTPVVELIVDTPPETEKIECWSAYTLITNTFKSTGNKLVDLISRPKANGYSAIHAMVMAPGGFWVKVQIRSERMDEIAKKGYAAYWKYKNNIDDNGLEKWLERTKELLWNSDDEAIPFLDAFQNDLFSDDIYVFTPKGDLITLPAGSTVLDFAYAIHTDLGNKSIGANVNHKLVSVDFKLRTGDQVEIITSKKQKPSEKQLDFVKTTRAKTWIKKAIKAERRKYVAEGESIFKQICSSLKAEQKNCDVKVLKEKLGFNDNVDFYYFLATGKIGLKEIKSILFPQNERKRIWKSMLPLNFSFYKKRSGKKENLLTGKGITKENLDYVISHCCNPIPGDDVVGIKKPDGKNEIHKTDCPEAIKLMSQFGKSVSNPKWGENEDVLFLAGIKLIAKNDIGLIKELTTVISDDFSVNIKKFNLETAGEIVTAEILIYVKNLKMLNGIIKKLRKKNNVIKVTRMENF